MKNKEYWKKRAEIAANNEFIKSDKFMLNLVDEYKKASNNMQKELESFYSKYAKDNTITFQDAKKMLNSKELSNFKLDVKEYIEIAKVGDFNKEWMDKLIHTSGRSRVSRIESLMIQVRQEVESITNLQHKGMSDLLGGIYENAYYHNLFDISKGLGMTGKFDRLDTRTVEKALSREWAGSNFSSRIWDNKDKLLLELTTVLTQSFIRGESLQKTASALAKRTGVATNRAMTLVSTESSYIVSEATRDSYRESGVVKQYEILATLDSRTSLICQDMDGEIINLSDMEIGVNAPPFHPRCRTTTMAYFAEDIITERIARGLDGKQYYVNGDMKYHEWFDKFVK